MTILGGQYYEDNSMNQSDANPRRTTQLAAIAWLRWRLFVNALRTRRGQLELASRILVTFAFTIFALGGAFGLGVIAYLMLSQGKPEVLAVFLWIIFFFWQVFPLLAVSYTHLDVYKRQVELWEVGPSFGWIIGLVILFVGMRFAWTITAGRAIEIFGPFDSARQPQL